MRWATWVSYTRSNAKLPDCPGRTTTLTPNPGQTDCRSTACLADAAAAKVPNNSATAKAIDYCLKRWAALTRYLSDGQIPIDNNWIENQIRPIALGRKNWLFAGSQRAGQRAAAIMSLIQSAKLNGHDPHAYLKDVLTRLPTQRASRIGELLPHRWRAEAALT